MNLFEKRRLKKTVHLARHLVRHALHMREDVGPAADIAADHVMTVIAQPSRTNVLHNVMKSHHNVAATQVQSPSWGVKSANQKLIKRKKAMLVAMLAVKAKPFALVAMRKR